MAHDPDLADAVRVLLAASAGGARLEEKRMFGGLAFLLDGRMAVAASGRGGLMVRVDPGESDALLARDGVEPVVMRDRETRGWLWVHLRADDPDLAGWVGRGVARAAAADTASD